jgi:hypothetical protein
MNTPQCSTLVGDWRVIKVRVDADPWVASRWGIAATREGDQDRNVDAIKSRLTSTNTVFFK